MSIKAILSAVQDQLQDEIERLKTLIPQHSISSDGLDDVSFSRQLSEQANGARIYYVKKAGREAFWEHGVENIERAYFWPELSRLEALTTRIYNYGMDS